MTVDIYLRADDREAMDAALLAAALIDGDGRPAEVDVRLSRIASMSQATGELDGEGLPVMQPVPGYHVNLRMLREPTEAEIAALAPVAIEAPATPYRIWFD